jgi:teichoic acid transport system ATP-binding protein
VSDVNEGTSTLDSPRLVNVEARGVEVAYQVFAESGRRPTFKQLVASGGRRRAARTVRAVQGVSFDVHEGEAVGLIGSNGSGKSTLLRATAGLLRTTAGSIRVRSVPVLMGVNAALEPELSGRRNVLLGGTALGLTRDEVEEAFDDIVQFAGVGDAIDLPLKTYSSGMAARLRFAISTAVQPDILMIDEALAVGDAEFQRRSRQRMERLLEEAKTIVLVSHSMGEIRRICTRAIWLDEGRIRQDGPVDDVVAAYEESVAQD